MLNSLLDQMSRYQQMSDSKKDGVTRDSLLRRSVMFIDGTRENFQAPFGRAELNLTGIRLDTFRSSERRRRVLAQGYRYLLRSEERGSPTAQSPVSSDLLSLVGLIRSLH